MGTRGSAMVGRDDEFRVVERALAAARAGRGGAVFVVGESGIGKSRLAAAAADQGFTEGMRLLRGRGSSIGPMVPFRPLTEALLSLLHSGDPIDVGELGPYRPILARLIPDWGPPAAPQEAGSPVALAEAVRRLAGLAGRDRGCLLVLDDMQDFDVETLAVVEYLADNLGRQPVLLLGTVRTDPGPALDLARQAGQRGSAVLVELSRLAAGDLRLLAGSYLETSPDTIPDELVEHLYAGSEGIPLFAEQLLAEMLDDRLLVPDGYRWRVAGELRAKVRVTLTRLMDRRLDVIGAEGRQLLSVAAVLGQRFPVDVLQAAAGLGDRALLSHLHAELTSQLVAPDEETPDWYAFGHPLIRDALLTLLTPGERTRLTRRAAAAVQDVHPGLPGEWCQLAATLHHQAGDLTRAGLLFADAGRSALALGAASSAVRLLDQALELLAGRDSTGDSDGAQVRADTFASLLYALAEAGLVERALASAGQLEQLAGLLSPSARAQLHTRLAWAAAVAGQTADGLAQVEVVRRLLGPAACARDAAAIDVVAAHLVLDVPGPYQAKEAEDLARRAAAVAEDVKSPLVACQAWQLLGTLARFRDPDEATGCLERARRIALQHDLPIEEIHALIRLGNDDALRYGNLTRLEQARQEATRAGAVTSRYQAEVSIALQQILRGDFCEARALLDQALEATMRLKLLETTQYGLLLRAVLAAHRGRRRDMVAALADLPAWGGDVPQNTPRIHGLARAWCALLEEDRPQALNEQALALTADEQSPTVFQLTGRYGLDLLLRVLDGTAGWPEYEAVTAAPAGKLRWDRQFALLARAVLAGRDGRRGEAEAAMAEALRVAAPYATARHLGLRLVSEPAIADGWGSPMEWLRSAEEYFHAGQVPAVASACRKLLRRGGVSVAQHRDGRKDIPARLRSLGVTVREYEILKLLADRLTNREIAARLHLSPRTVERHIASLITKTGKRNRIGLGELGSGL